MQQAVKRFIDLLVAFSVLLIMFPVILLVAASIKKTMGGPVFFRQRRPGYKGQLFEMVKFRTMTTETQRDGRDLLDSERTGRLGRFLRKTSLDELPQLLNVVRGEMSLVGPRPLLPQYLEFYTEEQSRRHDVRPGITGLAQVQGRRKLSFLDRLALDVWYVDNWSLLLDAKIIVRTIIGVLQREGVEPTSVDSGQLRRPEDFRRGK